MLDTGRAKSSFGFEATMPFEEGLRRTIDWYKTEGRELVAATGGGEQ